MDKRLIIAALIGVGVWWWETQHQASDDPQSENLMDSTMTKIDEATGALSGPGPVDGMRTSPAMLGMLKRRETCRLLPYNLGDGGWTIGWGHQYGKYETVPASITQAEADAMFIDDVVNRGEKWVKLYVSTDLAQCEFDALVSIAYNMSPQSFKKFADQVNAGNGIDDIADQSVAWVADKYKNGIQNRRDAEVNVFDNGVYA